jgi:hypothetical protein
MHRRLLALLAAPIALVGALAVAGAADDPASKAKSILSELEAKRSQPALSAPSTSASSASGELAPDGGAVDAAIPAPKSSPVAAADAAIANAKRMLDKAAQLRALSDAARADLAEDVALEWAETARDLVAAVEDERSADEQGKAAIAMTTKAERARQLLEEAIARRGRLQAELDALEKDAVDKALDAGPPDAPKKKGGAK